MLVDSEDRPSSGEGRPFRVLVVDGQPSVVWALSHFLELAGYEAIQAGSGEVALAALDQADPHFVIAGWDIPGMSGVELCRRVRARDRNDYVFTFLLASGLTSGDLVDALQAGADDFLNLPMIHGELLSRLRAGARTLEYERRLSQRGALDRLTGLGSRRAFVDRLSVDRRPRQRRSSGHRQAAVSCVLVDLDYFGRFNRLAGRAAADATLKAVSELLVAACKKSDGVYRVGDNRFGVLLAGTTESEAANWAERCRAALAELELPFEAPPSRLTASFGVASIEPGLAAEAALGILERPLRVAKHSGRDRVVMASGMAAITSAGADGAGPADPLRSALARDVMTSNVLSLHERETLASAAELMRDARLLQLPVVDADGKLLGTASMASIAQRATGQQPAPGTVAEVLAIDPPCFEEETTVQALFDFFRGEEADRVEIVHAGRPTGFVTRGSLAALGQPLTLDTFSSAPAGYGSGALLVADLEMVEEA